MLMRKKHANDEGFCGLRLRVAVQEAKSVVVTTLKTKQCSTLVRAVLICIYYIF